jgi:triose/dihydroxyacetone kinase / FAD-AMP lyase (cyclizing)
LVNAALHSLTLTNPSVSVDAESKIVYRSPNPAYDNQVGLVSGGGSGHEPSFAGFVGDGLLAASVAGTIFASPSAEQIRRAVMGRVPRDKGVVIIVMNYTGDVLNFGMACEKAKASGIDVGLVVVGDDAGVGKKKGGKVGRRGESGVGIGYFVMLTWPGIAGTCLVLKVAGALAATGASLEDVVRIAQLTADNVISVGASLLHVHVPGRSVAESSEDDLGEGEIEVGMGIHNEPGSERVKTNLVGLVEEMLKQMLDPSDEDRNFLQVSSENQTALLINNLGGVSVLEIGGITDEVVKQLDAQYGIKPVRVLAGTFMTSLNGVGFSISLLKLTNTKLGNGKSMLELLDAPAEAVGWSPSIRSQTWDIKREAVSEVKVEETEVKPSNIKGMSVLENGGIIRS